MISTKTTPESKLPKGDFVNSALEPGNFRVRLLNIFLQPERDPKFGDKLIMKLESEPIGGNFRGFKIDPADESKGTFAGRTGSVSYTRYGYKDFTFESGDVVLKEEELQIAIRDICEIFGIMSWYDGVDGKYQNMSEFIKGFDLEQPFKGIWFNICISGRQYLNKANYVNHEMWVTPDHKTLGVGMHLDPAKVQKFVYSQHVIPLGTTTSPKPETTSKPAETSKSSDNQSAEDFLAEINAPVEQTYHKDPVDPTQPVRPAVTSQAEANFMNDGPKSTNTPITDGILKEGSVEEALKDDSKDNRLPWEID